MKREPLVIGDLTAEIPLVQGGMGVGISLSGLAGAVAKEGGIGVISTAQIGFRDPEFDEAPIETNLRCIGEEINKAREIAPGGIIGCNIMVATKRYEDYVRAAVKAGSDIIISGAGLPSKLPELVRGFRTKIAPIVSSVKAAVVICKLWDRHYQTAPDMVVIEGPKAGGHLGFREQELSHIEELDYDGEIRKITEVVRQCGMKYGKKIPVVVAGGIYDRMDVEHCMNDLGADGVQVGTRFVTTRECDAPAAYKQAYIDAKKEDIVITKSPVGMPGRAILNKFLREVKERRKPASRCHQCLEKCDPKEMPYCITDALLNAARGKIQDALLFCGANAFRAERIETVREVIADLM
ncbi:nitronate monooxygenase family protein [Lacrimispora sp. NSJ-141]|uniref:Probable nitronate monooxygenase n=1 Tax=Lientehia hominis TaxID=2897778 RepID=A0AAP2RJT0_9FIRM|nr:nitronate monooxygenase family protein [Lientehia hominis]MCD2493532.1 nitronate monooxygenase family protein [Lientehia hominis]